MLRALLLCLAAAPARAGLLSEIADLEISPPGVRAVRPDVVFRDGTFLVGATELQPSRSFALLSLDHALKPLGWSEVLPARPGEVITDLRLASAPGGRVWAAFETAVVRGPAAPDVREMNYTQWAALRIDQGVFDLERRSRAPVATRPGGPPPRPDGTELTDDPAPFCWRGRCYIGTRRWGRSDLTLYSFDASSQRRLAVSRLVLPEELGVGMALGVYSLVDIAGRVWLVGGLDNRKPGPLPGSESYLVAAPLNGALTAFRPGSVILSRTREYQHYVAGARYRDGRLFVVHNIFAREFDGPQKARLKVFDVERGFRLLADASIDDGYYRGDNHATLEVVGDKVYVFYPTPEDTLRVKVFRIGD